jgi:hypothetical protein
MAVLAQASIRQSAVVKAVRLSCAESSSWHGEEPDDHFVHVCPVFPDSIIATDRHYFQVA